ERRKGAWRVAGRRRPGSRRRNALRQLRVWELRRPAGQRPSGVFGGREVTFLVLVTIRIALATYLAAASLCAAEYPSAKISSGDLLVKLYLPDARTGFYRASR